LKRLLKEHAKEERSVARELIQDFAVRFEQNHGLILRFEEEAIDQLIEDAAEQRGAVRDLCNLRFKDFQFGLKLIAQNTGQKEFTIDRNAVASPDKTLSEWVVSSYRPDQDGSSGKGKAGADSSRES
jgi:hypothetical protein